MPLQVASTERMSSLRRSALSLANACSMGMNADGVHKVGRVFGQEQQPGSGGPDGAADRFAFAAAEVVHDDDVARGERGQEPLLDIG